MNASDKSPRRPAARAAAAFVLLLAMLSPAQAHLMVGQRGTLNIVDNGAFMVLSVPVSSFAGVDDDGDGGLSMIEFNHHRDALTAAVIMRARLLNEGEPRPLEGIMLAPSIPDDDALGSASHLVVMGRFALPETDAPLSFDVDLFGTGDDEQTLSIAVTHKATGQTQALILGPDQPARELFPSSLTVFADFVHLGAQHIFEGPDHLLFLLVVLASGWGLRQVVTLLTVFTIGHAVTLIATVYGGLYAPAAVVEPTIAATIVGMALFHLRNRRAGEVLRPWVRPALVFGCSLIHGFGLAGALNEMGFDSGNRLPSLAGFNVGIEAAQLIVAFAAAALALGAVRLFGTGSVNVATRVASVGALAIGSAWFVQRVAGIA